MILPIVPMVIRDVAAIAIIAKVIFVFMYEKASLFQIRMPRTLPDIESNVTKVCITKMVYHTPGKEGLWFLTAKQMKENIILDLRDLNLYRF